MVIVTATAMTTTYEDERLPQRPRSANTCKATPTPVPIIINSKAPTTNTTTTTTITYITSTINATTPSDIATRAVKRTTATWTTKAQ